MLSLFTKLVEIFERRWNEGRQPRRRLARAVTALYSALVSCHDAYTRYETTRDPEAFRQWAIALDSLVTSLANMDDTLELFAPELTAELRRYVRSERRVFGGSDPQNLADAAIGELAYVVGERASPFDQSARDLAAIDEDMSAPINRLGEFIRSNFKIEEIYGELGSA